MTVYPASAHFRVNKVWANFKPAPNADNVLEAEDTEFSVFNPFPKRMRNDNADQLAMYLQQPVEARSIDVLAYWKCNRSKWPQLTEMARVFLAIPATSASSERAFSAAEHVISPSRCSMKPPSVQSAVCLNSWMKCGLLPEGFRL